MKVGFIAFPNQVEGYIEFAATHGFEHMEIDLYSEPQRLGTFTKRRVSDLRRLAEASNLPISFHAPYTMNLAEHLPEIRRAVLGYFERLIRMACDIGALWVCVHPGYGIGLPTLDWIRPAALDRLRQSLAHLLPICERYGMVLTLENVNPLPKQGELVFLGDSIEEIRSLLDEFDNPWLRMCLDVGHANIAEGAVTYISAFHDKIITTHIHDNSGTGDEHQPIGKGTVPWDDVIAKFKEFQFQGPLNVEVFDDQLKVEGGLFLKRLIERHRIRNAG